MEDKASTAVLAAFVLLACVAGLPGAASDPKTTASIPTPEPTSPPTSPIPSSSIPPTTPPTTPPTPPPTTTSSPATTTTEQPTTPAPAPITTPAPTPSDGRGNWSISADNVTCIMAQMVISAKISYPLEAVNKTGTADIVVPASAKAIGSCNNSPQYLELSWEKNNTFKLVFVKNDTNKVYFISDIVLSVYADQKIFPNISSKLENSMIKLERKSAEFKTTLSQSYRCSREESLPLSLPNSTSNNGVLVLDKLQLQAFHTEKSAVFGTAQDCELDTPDIVPIAVGCALAALVCVVLVAYLVGRRRSQARGYLSISPDGPVLSMLDCAEDVMC